MYSDRTKNLCSIGAAVISAYWWLTHSGGFLLLSKLQISLIGRYFPLITFLLCLAAVQFVFEKGYRLWKDSSNDDKNGDLDSAEPMEPSLFDDLFKQSQWFYQSLGIAVGTACAAVMLGIPAINSLELEELDLASLELGTTPTSSWVSAENAKLYWDEALVMEHRHNNIYYVPLVSNGWSPGQPVAAFLQATESEADKLDDFASFEGMCSMRGIPSDVMHYVNSELDIEVADTHILVNMNGNPESSKNIALISAAICVLSSFFSVFAFKSSERDDDFFNLENRAGSKAASYAHNLLENETEPIEDPDADMKRWLAERNIDYKA